MGTCLVYVRVAKVHAISFDLAAVIRLWFGAQDNDKRIRKAESINEHLVI